MRRARAAWVLLPVLLLVSLLAGIAFGSESLPVGAVVASLGHRMAGRPLPESAFTADTIIWALRVPRVLLGLFVGGGLAVIGVGIQALVRNPLAEPYILGISSGASVGASLFYLGFLPPLLSKVFSMPLAAFAGAMVAILIVYYVASSGPVLSVARLLLAGVAVSSLMAALTSLITLASPDLNRTRAVLFWLLGSLSGARWEMIAVPAVVSVAGLLTLLALSRSLDALLLGEEPAVSLGVPVEAVKRVIIVLAALVTGGLVASAGAIGFVGLIVPHLVRAMAGVAHRRVVPLSFVAGAVFLILSDLAARTLLPGQELPVGILTALCGVPFFLALLRRSSYRFG